MRIVFMGTPDFAVASLQALVSAGHQVCGVFSQPDKPVGRHQNKLQPTPVKVCAQACGIPVFQPVTLRDGSALEQLRELDPQLIVAAAYGRVLPQEMLALPPLGCINVHSSLLPKYRGAAPINWAILNGEKETGVTIMDMAPELDAGDIIAQAATDIEPNETAQSLHDRLAAMGGALLVETVARIENGTASRTPQNAEQVTYAPMLSRALSPMDWGRSAWELHNQIRGLAPWPAASTDLFSSQPVKVFSSAVLERQVDLPPRTILTAGKEGIDVVCGGGTVLRILELQAPGSRRMSAADYLRGHPIEGDKN